MFPSASQVELLVRKVREQPSAVTLEDLHVLGGAILLTLRDDDLGLAAEYSKLADGNDVQQDVVESLTYLPVDPVNPTIGPLLSTFERDPQFYEAMHALLAQSIPKLEGKIKCESLGLMQIEILNRLAASDPIWHCDMTIRDRLIERGLPDTRHRLRRMLAAIDSTER
jgi:hypothetical protein